MKIKIWIATNKIRSKAEKVISLDDESWNEANEWEKDEMVFDELVNRCMFEWGYESISK